MPRLEGSGSVDEARHTGEQCLDLLLADEQLLRTEFNATHPLTLTTEHPDHRTL